MSGPNQQELLEAIAQEEIRLKQLDSERELGLHRP